MNPSILTSVGAVLQNLGLSILIGGMLVLGAMVAPSLFKSLPREQAGQILTGLFRRYDLLLLVGLIMILIGEAFRYFSTANIMLTALHWVRYGILVILTVLVCLSVFMVNPKIEAMQKAGEIRGKPEVRQEFLYTHELSENLFKIELLAGLILLTITPFAYGACSE